MPNAESPIERSTLAFFVVVAAVSLPIWLAGQVLGTDILPGVPISALMTLVPGVVAFVFVVRVTRFSAAVQWVANALRPRAIGQGRWLLVAALMPAVILTVTYWIMELGGSQLPAAQLSAANVAMLVAIFLLPAVLEEVGWCSFALIALQRRMSALEASLLIGIVWALWHFVPLLQADRSFEWIAWWSVTTIALRVLTTWVFNNTGGSALLAAVFHASENVSWQSFPIQGSHYDPAVHALVLGAVCCFVVAIFGPRALVRRA